MSEGLLAKLKVEQGLPEQLPSRVKRNATYTKPARPPEQSSLLSNALDNKFWNE
ncbi:hypothetical protein [Sideroxydans sp. CL21]|uniref:hypothetical protein n=1 Tax=Sideroxydans sp. CL21 TaxID=2600596 RepID=UPI0024BBF9CD|nr:hypothetical protein [Sideroxydans sp. CL21]